jgi:alkylation response protein AidB-like acyl-CoA dehydrogenase
VRHLEEKLGIHGSPTCELVYDDAPAKLIGERQRGLITLRHGLMNGARSASRPSRWGSPRRRIASPGTTPTAASSSARRSSAYPAVAELLVDMKIAHRGGAGADYETAACDLENNNLRVLEFASRRATRTNSSGARSGRPLVQAAQRHAHADEQVLRLRDVIRVANDALQVLGGSGT